MLIECIATIVACALMSQPDQTDATWPTVHIRVLNPRPVIGEPVLVEIVASNPTPAELCIPPRLGISGGLAELRVYASRGDVYVGKSLSSAFCGRRLGAVMVGGRCADSLQPGQELHGHGLAVLLKSKGEHINARTTSAPLDPGRYTLTADVIWGDWQLKTNSIQLEVIAATSPDDVRASELADHTFASFMSSYPTMGMGADFLPDRSVKAILEQCPTSVHARLARSRLLVLQAQKHLSLPGGVGPTTEIRGKREQRMLEIVKEIETRLVEDPNDPLELDLLQARVELLRRFEVLEPLEDALGVLINRYPKSTYARQGRKMLQDVRDYRRETSGNASKAPEK